MHGTSRHRGQPLRLIDEEQYVAISRTGRLGHRLEHLPQILGLRRFLRSQCSVHGSGG